MTTSPQYDVFISYAQDDKGWAEGYLRDALETAGLRCLSPLDLRPGALLLAEYERVVTISARILLVISPAYLSDEHNQFIEYLGQVFGRETGTWPVVPILLHPVEQMPLRLAALVQIDATDPVVWPEVVARLAGAPPTAIAVAPPRCPYPGLRTFAEEDSDTFFGREAEVEEMLQRLRKHPFLAVIGPSGSGKSSLVFAGLVPALRGSGLFGPAPWRVRSLRPGHAPQAALQAALAALGDGEAGRRLLIVDQFEETFALAGAEGAAFQEALLERVKAGELFLVLTVRADYYPELLDSPLWPQVQAHRLELRKLGERGLRRAIVNPAAAVGVYVEPALVERLIADAGDEPGILPLLQETLVLLWERVQRRYLPLSAYERLAVGGRSGIQTAIARHADAIYTNLSPDQQTIARRVLLSLIHFGQGRADIRRRQTLADLQTAGYTPAQVEATVRALAQGRLLTLASTAGQEDVAVDLAHEALIRGWPRLAAWIDASRRSEETRRRLWARAQDWLRLGQSGGWMGGAELREAESWLASDDHRLTAHPRLLEFIADSRQHERRQKRQRLLLPLLAVLGVALLALVGLFTYRAWLHDQALRASPQVAIDGGAFFIGTDEAGIDPYSHPRTRVEWPDFALDQHEVSNRQYCLCVRANACPDHAYDTASVCQPDLADLPVVDLTQATAARYCAWLDRRLPTEIEWERAAAGDAGRTFPSGFDYPSADDYVVSRTGRIAEPSPVAAMPHDRTPEGIVGMGGNTREWTLSPYLRYDDPGYAAFSTPATLAAAEGFVVIRGGSFRTGIESARVVARVRHLPEASATDLGFRCARGPAPPANP